MILLKAEDIRKTFAIRKGFIGKPSAYLNAVDGVSFSLEKGENLSLVGESGCGKTTLARMIMRLIPVSSGTLLFEGQEITSSRGHSLKKLRQRIQMVFQDPYSSLDPRFTIRSTMKEPMHLNPLQYKTPQDQERRISSLLKIVGLQPDMLNRYPHEFSGGERQRIAIARALVTSPKLLILDEAVSSLDVIIQEQILDLLKELQGRLDLTYLFISHNLKVVRKISHVIAVMYKGKIVEWGRSEEIFKNPLHPYTQELLSAAVEYRSVKREKEMVIDSRASLQDQGNGHFVLK